MKENVHALNLFHFFIKHAISRVKPFQSLPFPFESIFVLTLASREVPHFLLLEINIFLVQTFKQETLDSSPSCSRLYNSRVVNEFHMNNEKSLMQCK